MTVYNAPIQDMKFVLDELFNVEDFWKSNETTAEFSVDLASAILEEAGKLSREVLFPLFRSGDEEGCHFQDGKVTTPQGFKEAYQKISEGGWCGLGGDPEFDGQGLPKMLVVLFEEMLFASNNSLALYPILSAGGAMCLSRHGSDNLKKKFLPKLYSGEWSSAMGLTEPHCGTDLGLINSKAIPNSDGSYAVTGTKIFITAGDHDMCDNIIHLVLAKLPGAPDGVRGISLFLLPKFLVNDNGDLGVQNSFSAGSIEHKMGIKGSATCVMNYDSATGWLVGEENQGLAAMFTMMNYERLSIGLQGLGSADMAYQLARDYALDRLQGRAANGAIDPSKPADAIIHHPDVRRMLLFVRAIVEGGRAFGSYVAHNLDIAHYANDEHKVESAQQLIALLIPVAKAFLSDKGLEACIQAQQVFGGHGYVREWGVEQLVRDARIAQIYEGTNGIQALDLMGRKVVRSKGVLLAPFYKDIQVFIDITTNEECAYLNALEELLEVHKKVSDFVIGASAKDDNEIGAASVDYLHLTGYLGFAFMWARMAKVSQPKQSAPFYQAKLHTCEFFFKKMLPQAYAHSQQILSTAQPTMAMPVGLF